MLSKSRDDQEAEELRLLEGMLAEEGRQLRGMPGRPNEQAFLAQLNVTPQSPRWSLGFIPQQLRAIRAASRSLFIGGAVFLGIAASAASAFVGDPLNLQALPLVNIGSSSAVDTPPVSEEILPVVLPVISPVNEAPASPANDPARGVGQGGTPPGQGGENPGNGGGNGEGVGQGGTPPGQGGENPGNGGENPGQGGGQGQGGGSGNANQD
ncbi:MAG TPA: hypothetical protein VFS30_03985 [Dehalococcoidia bacterium]|nr:hypothetical protein [Dehalococcoidia bacterium]